MEATALDQTKYPEGHARLTAVGVAAQKMAYADRSDPGSNCRDKPWSIVCTVGVDGSFVVMPAAFDVVEFLVMSGMEYKPDTMVIHQVPTA